MKLSLGLLAAFLVPQISQASESKVRFVFFGKPVVVDCSKVQPGAWSVENFAHGGIRRFLKNPGFFPSCTSENFSVTKTIGDVSYSAENPAETVFDAEGNVESLYSMQTKGNRDLFELHLNPKVGRVWPTMAADVTFHTNGALRRFQVAHGQVSFSFQPAGGELQSVKSIEFSREGKLVSVVPCVPVPGYQNCQ